MKEIVILVILIVSASAFGSNVGYETAFYEAGKSESPFCHGVIVAPKWILSAASCFYHDHPDDQGIHTLKIDINKIVEKITRSKIKGIKKFYSVKGIHDIALVLTYDDLTIRVGKVEAPTADLDKPGHQEHEGDEGLVFGSRVKVVLDNQCQGLPGWNDNSGLICVQHLEQSSCVAGSPLVIQRRNKLLLKKPVVIGVSIGCPEESGTENGLAVYTRVSSYSKWAKAVMDAGHMAWDPRFKLPSSE